MDIFRYSPRVIFQFFSSDIFLWAMLFLFHMLQRFLQNKLISTKGKREGKIRVIFIFVLNFLIALNWY